MKKLFAVAATILTATTSTSATAGSAADLNVIGSFAPRPCTVVIPGGHQFNFGTLKTDDLDPTQPTQFELSKVITITCPAPTGIWVAFPFDNGGQLQPHGSSIATGQLDWLGVGNGGAGINSCNPTVPENYRTKFDDGDGVLKDTPSTYVRILRGRPMVQRCPSDFYFDNGVQHQNGAEDGFYIGAPAIVRMQIPRFLRMTINPRDNLETSGAIQLRGGATVVVNYI